VVDRDDQKTGPFHLRVYHTGAPECSVLLLLMGSIGVLGFGHGFCDQVKDGSVYQESFGTILLYLFKQFLLIFESYFLEVSR